MPTKKSQKKRSKVTGTGKATSVADPELISNGISDLSVEVKEKCSVCSLPAPKRCGRCKQQFYCSGEHQRLDWKSHKVKCVLTTNKPPPAEGEVSESLGYKIENVKEFGTCMVAYRNFDEGELILTETPAVILPVQGYGDEKCLPSCFGCFQAISTQDGTGNFVYRCSRCGIPMCGPTCERAPQHREQECKVIREMEGKLRIRGLGNDLKVLQLYLDICVLRVLLYSQRNPKQWEDFLQLENTSRMAFHKRCPIYSSEILTDPKNGFGLNLSLKFAGKNKDVVMQASHLLFAHWDVMFASDVSPRMRVLFPKLASLTHCCIPNAVYTHTNKDSISMSLRAGRRICKGEILTLNYSFDPWSDTLTRREALLQKSIVCICSRCKDPTEFGSNCGGVRCNHCSSGLLLPQFPLSPVGVKNKKIMSIRDMLIKTKNEDKTESGDIITIEETILIANLIKEKENFIETRTEGRIETKETAVASKSPSKLQDIRNNLPDSESTSNTIVEADSPASPDVSESEETVEEKLEFSYRKMNGWKCINQECNYVIGPTYVTKFVEYVETEYKLMKRSCKKVLELEENIKQFIEKYDSMEVLGPYHPIILVAADDFLHAERSRLFYGPSLTDDQEQDTAGRIILGLPPSWNPFELERFQLKRDYSKRLCSFLDMTKSYDLSIHRGYATGDLASSTLVLQAWAYKTKAITSLEFHKSVRQSLENLQSAAKMLHVFVASTQDYRYSKFLETIIERTLLIVRNNLDLAPKLILEMLGMYSEGDTGSRD